MSKQRLFIAVWVGLFAVAIGYGLLKSGDFSVLEPAGYIGQEQRDLILFASWLSLIIVLPVFAMTFGFAWRYREGNKRAKYSPKLEGNIVAETIWWGVPLLLITILSVVTWRSTHQLDPFKPLASKTPPITIQVVALQWKWLFIYPDQGIATVNDLRVPVATPLNFQITADAPMNSFWIPKLGGQMYAMSGMSTELHLIADESGTFEGSSANISGEGFAKMRFPVKAVNRSAFDAWVKEARQSSQHLDLAAYDRLAQPDLKPSRTIYGFVQPNLYQAIVSKYTLPTANQDYSLEGRVPAGVSL